jgi:hypothetical protein
MTLALRTATPLDQGTRRIVYQHPDDPDALVKVVQHENIVLKRETGRFKSWRRRLGLVRSSVHAEFRREMREITALRARLGAIPDCIADMHGIVATDLGPGVIVQKIRGRDGGLAPTLGALLRAEGLTESRREQLERLGACITRAQAVLNNLSLHNIVVAFDPQRGERLVLIDCVGEKTLIPLQSMSRSLTRHANKKHLRRLMKRVDEVAASRTGGG